MIRDLSVFAVLVSIAAPVQAAQKTIVLNVDKADCELCAPIVKRTVSRVSGVSAVQLAEANATAPAVATVTFDDAVTSVETIVKATTNAGYPSHPVQ